MNQYFTEKKPGSFTFNRRLHRVTGWLELVHELLEDLFMTADPEGSVISGITIPETDKKIVCGKDYPGKAILLSNGLFLPAEYEEQEYALGCRSICLAYGITPCEMSIEYTEDEKPAHIEESSQPQAVQTVLSEEPEPEAETGPETNPGNDISTVKEDNVSDKNPVFAPQPEHTRGKKFFSDTEEMWLKIMLNKEDRPSNHIRLASFDEKHKDTVEKPDWDKVIEEIRYDKQALAAAKVIRKAGVKPPVPNFRGIREQNKVGGEALFVWMDEGVAYLHGRQKYGKGYFLEHGFSHVIVDNPREVLDCFREMEAENE